MDTITRETSETEEKTRDRRFCPTRHPRSPRATAVVAEIIQQIEQHEARNGLRRRRRRPDDQKTFEETVTAVVADLIHREPPSPAGGCRCRFRTDFSAGPGGTARAC
jgi:hypothetical protein